MNCVSFPPIVAPDPHTLIVGSMPSVRSLCDTQYYAHPRNAFWPILFAVFGETPSADYAKKTALIRAHNLALWDVAARCEREGSLDSAMRNITFNDFARLYAMCPHIKTVLCNGATAYGLFLKSGAAGGKTVLRLPSTSPAYTLPYHDKLDAWRRALMGENIL